MFYDREIKILDNEQQVVRKILGDLQPYHKNFHYEDGYELEITQRAFCDREPLIHKYVKLMIGDIQYKVLDMKVWSDYLELWLYECRD
ncbi:hypothetical protein [Natronincola ferrireducens]|uniref:Uncharacterized protein n=1 Tax=Natronincola ferrireducens TaxID=393762 RepID=A0A1G9IH99_9FIRM|nr:hypothetical protein [Natronincola ferrireducens]SDL24618.1 hypothetical protein SAMN05660472_02873 [Natronincola ferrireducens]